MYSKQKSFQFGQYIPNDKILNKKIHENPKYKHVKPAVDSGKHVVKQINEYREKQKYFSSKKDEIFKRLKLSTFVKLIICAGLDFLKAENTGGDAFNADAKESKRKSEEVPTTRWTVSNVIMGIGEMDERNDRRKPVPVPPKPVMRLPYLLLDVRDREDFLRFHIKTAKHYPAAMISRSSGYETEEMKSYKNDPYELIIVYDDDEVIASRVATTLVERGYKNIYLLSGGLKFALENCPHGLTTSSPPIHLPSINQASSEVQPVTAFEHFTMEDIDYMSHYMGETFSYAAAESRCSSQSRSSSSCYKKDRNCTQSTKANGTAELPPLPHESLSSRKNSAGSSRSVEHAHRAYESKSALYSRSKQHDTKAPWK